MKMNDNAVNFTYVLLEYYKELNISEIELVVLLMIEHLNNQENTFITSSNLALKMSMSKEEIDRVLTGLYKKRYIDINTKNDGPYTSIEQIKKIVFKKFQDDLFETDNASNDDEIDEIREEVFEQMELLFSRSLSPVEINRIDDWIVSGTPKNIIIDSIKDAKRRDCSSINQVDSIIVRKMREEDGQGNTIKR